MTILEATEKISGVTQSRFGCPVLFHYAPHNKGGDESLDQTNPLDKIQQIFTVVGRNPTAPFILSQQDILIPVCIENDIYGCIEVAGGGDLELKALEEVCGLVDNTLKEFVIKTEVLRRLKIQEATLASMADSKVVPLFQSPGAEEQSTFRFIRQRSDSLKTALFISSEGEEKARTLAMDLHGLLHKKSFVPYEALSFKGDFVAEMLGLGNITIFIPELLNLPAYEIEDITNYLLSQKTSLSPFLIVSSQKSLEELKEEPHIPVALLEIFQGFHLETLGEKPPSQIQHSMWEQEPPPDLH